MLALAAQAGANAVILFLAVLFLGLMLAIAGWWVCHSNFMTETRQRTPHTVYWICNLLGLMLIAGGVFVFIEIVDDIAADGQLLAVDATITQSIRTHASVVSLQIFAVVTHFGDRPVLFAIGGIVTIVLWRHRYRLLAIGWALSLAGNAILNPMLKQLFERVRPLNEQGLAGEVGWSFPSGHTSGAMVTYGMLAYVALRTLASVWHLPVILAMVLIVLAVGFSRIFLQVHFASDVAAGFASGVAWLAVCILTIELIEHYQRPNRLPR